MKPETRTRKRPEPSQRSSKKTTAAPVTVRINVDVAGCKKQLHIGVDCGTTYSGAAYHADDGDGAQTYNHGQIRNVDEWAGDEHPGLRFPKCPTSLLYLSHEPRDLDDGLLDMEEVNDPKPLAGEWHTIAADHASTATAKSGAKLTRFAGVCKSGYLVKHALKTPDLAAQAYCIDVALIKLMLSDGEHTRSVREGLQQKINQLKGHGCIKDGDDLLIHYLSDMFEHLKRRMQQNKTFNFEEYDIRVVISVPVQWSRKANQRMERAVAMAMKAVGFGRTEDDCVQNLLLISEAECSAYYILRDAVKVKENEVFLILDSGGGTVDATMFRASKTLPLSLVREELAPAGALCGSNYLNERFKAYAIAYLTKFASYLTSNSEYSDIIDVIDEKIVPEFDDRKKRIDFDAAERNKSAMAFKISGLKADKEHGFKQGVWVVEKEQLRQVFDPLLDEVADLMEQQVLDYHKKNKRDPVAKIILTGGFADSKALRAHLQRRAEKISQRIGYDLLLLSPNDDSYGGWNSNAVAQGAVIRSVMLSQGVKGPDRIPQASYGLLRHEPVDKIRHPEHGMPGVKRRKGLDGTLYVWDTLQWIICKGSEPLGENVPFEGKKSRHCFEHNADELIIKEVLMVSDSSTESHYAKNHKKNKGCEEWDNIEVDITWLRDQGLLTLERPKPDSVDGAYYEVDVVVQLKLVGLKIDWELWWKNGKQARKLLARRMTSVAAGFNMGSL